MTRSAFFAGAYHSVAFRVIAGTLGAFVLASVATTLLALVLAWLGMTRANAVTTALMASSIIFALISLAVFHSRSTLRAWGWLAGTALPLAVLTWVLMPKGAS